MANPTTRGSTPPASSRIGQQAPTNAVVLSAYNDGAFPGIAFTNQLVIDFDNHTLAYYDTNGAWQGVVGSAGLQTFYQSTEPTTGMNYGDLWYDTDNDNLLSRFDGSDWIPVPIGSDGLANTITGVTIETAATGTRWVLASAASSGGTQNKIVGYSGANSAVEQNPAFIEASYDNSSPSFPKGYLILTSPIIHSALSAAAITMWTDGGTAKANIVLDSDYFEIDATDIQLNGNVALSSDVGLTTLVTGVQYRVRMGFMYLYFNGTISTTSGTTLTIAAAGTIPTALRPFNTIRGGAYFGTGSGTSGIAGIIQANSDGSITALQNTGAAKTTISGSLIWPL